MNAVARVETAADQAERLVAGVRDDPAARMRFAVDTYPDQQRYRPYARAVVAFMRWQDSRGVLNPLRGEHPGSPWWRAVNEDLLRDTCEARILVEHGGEASGPAVRRWIDFFRAPSARSWYLAHNGSVVAGYLAHRDLASFEMPAERFFMNVTLLRVLYAQALVFDGVLALGRLSFLSRLVGHPRTRSPEAFLAIADILPDVYPIESATVEEVIDRENPWGRILDYAVISARTDALYASAAHALGEPRLLDLVRAGAPVYAWPYESRHVWRSPGAARSLKSLLRFLTGPRIGRATT